ncbi:MAG: hypothetical protein AUK08_00900 [Candidatus Pacebacteria bacterium CG2_30_36_39]|nr:glycosyltransferase family 39 protein [Candidatus Pacearchaeota archaeon]OIP74326.1 MAG: hypothetical protein AUK08_00900 [Candidatus Pacebacteria bacterium CG2_30_36_39]
MKLKAWVKNNWLYFFFILSSGFLYFYNLPNSFHFSGDQGRDVLVMKDLLDGKSWPLLGPTSSVGHYYLGPLFYYFNSPSLLLTNFNPIGPALLQALVGITMTVALFCFLKQFFNYKIAVIATTWYLLLPTFVEYNRFAWNPNAIPLFLILFFWSLAQFIKLQKEKFFLIALINLFILLQLHLINIVLLLPLLISVYQSWLKHHNIKSIITKTFYSILTTITALFPFIYGLFKQIGLSKNKSSLINPLSLVQNIGINLKEIIWLLAGKNIFLSLLIIIIFILSIYLIIKNIKLKAFNLSIKFLIIPTILVSIISLSLLNIKPTTHYLFIPLIGLLILISWAIDQITKTIPSKIISNILLLIILLTTVYSWLPQWLEIFKPNSISAKKINETTTLILENSNSQPFQVAILSEDNSDEPYLYYLKMKSNLLIRDQEFAKQIFIVCEDQESCKPHGNPHWEIAKFEINHQDKQIEELQINDNLIKLFVR